MKKIGYTAMSFLAFMALKVTYANANSCCMYVMHQPKLPEGADRFRNHNR